jgi:hypothetical protein
MFGLLSSPLGFLPAPRASAESLTPAAPYPFTHVDDILIDEGGYDVGGDGFANGSPVEPAKLTWTAAWFGSSPVLTGKFHFDGAERCARVVLISFDASGAEMSPRDYSDEECPGDLEHQTDVITKGGNPGVNARADAAKVQVQLQTQNTNLSWSNAGPRRTSIYGPVLDTDTVDIFRERVDLGSGAFDGTNPAAPATLTWESQGGPISANLQGTMYLKGAFGLCYRMHVAYKKHDGTLLEDPRHGNENCAGNTDELVRFPVNTGGAFADNELAEVTYAIERRGGEGDWETVGAASTHELGDAHIIIDTNVDPTLP